MLKKIIKLNLDDLWLYIGIEGGLFLLMEVVICCVMRFVHPEDSVTVSSVVLPIIAGFISLVAGIAHVGVIFEQALAFGQTRRRATGLTLGLMAFETAFGMLLALVLSTLERFVCPHLWAWMAGAEGWVPSPDLAEGNVLLIDVFTLDWYWWLLAFVLGIGGGLIAGAVIQRFGSKGGWIVYGVCFAPMILGQIFPWESWEITSWLIPLACVLFVFGVLWSLWSMLHAVVRA